jgi:putative endonuclease
MQHFVYIMASRPFGAIYIGRTRNLRARVEQHRAGLSQHTARYGIKTLVWFEAHDGFAASIQREHALKRWRRAWKDELIARTNPDWQDVSAEIPL